MAKNEKFYPIYCSAVGKKGATPFQGTDPADGKTKTYWVELNKAVNVPEWVYEIWVGSYWNQDRKKSQEEQRAESHNTTEGNMSCEMSL